MGGQDQRVVQVSQNLEKRSPSTVPQKLRKKQDQEKMIFNAVHTGNNV